MEIVTVLFCDKCDSFEEVAIKELETDEYKNLKCLYVCKNCNQETKLDYKPS